MATPATVAGNVTKAGHGTIAGDAAAASNAASTGAWHAVLNNALHAVADYTVYYHTYFPCFQLLHLTSLL